MKYERMKLNWWTFNYTQFIYVTFDFGRSFANNSKISTQEYIYIRYGLSSSYMDLIVFMR